MGESASSSSYTCGGTAMEVSESRQQGPQLPPHLSRVPYACDTLENTHEHTPHEPYVRIRRVHNKHNSEVFSLSTYLLKFPLHHLKYLLCLVRGAQPALCLFAVDG